MHLEASIHHFVVTTVNYPAVTIREGDRIPLNVEGASSVQWKNARRSSSGHVPIPYSGCYGSLRSHPNSLPSAQASRLLNYYFAQSSLPQASWGYRSPPIILQSKGSGIIEVELTAKNVCGCTTAVNHYLVSVSPSSSSLGGHSLTVSPNPATASVNIQVKAPPFQRSPEEDKQAAMEDCCRKFLADPLSDMRPYPECCKYQQQASSRPIPSMDILASFFSYTLKVVQTSTRSVRHTASFSLQKGSSKTVSLNVSAWPKGLYVVDMYVLNSYTNQGYHLTRKLVIQ